MLEDIAKNYKPPELAPKHLKNNKKQKPSHNNSQEVPENLFDILPFKDVNLNDDTQNKPYVCVTYLPGATHHRLKRAFTKAGVNMVTRSSL